MRWHSAQRTANHAHHLAFKVPLTRDPRPSEIARGSGFPAFQVASSLRRPVVGRARSRQQPCTGSRGSRRCASRTRTRYDGLARASAHFSPGAHSLFHLVRYQGLCGARLHGATDRLFARGGCVLPLHRRIRHTAGASCVCSFPAEKRD